MIPHVVAFGGGVDSTAMVLGLIENKKQIDLILFADTGAERPETYAHIDKFSAWLKGKGYPEIIIVKRTRRDGSLETLEEECLRRNNLPAIAYGFKSCSEKHKIRPQNKFMNHWQPALDTWAAGNKCVKYIGYDANETRRAENVANRNDPKYVHEYPLIEWDWDRDDCLAIIEKYGFTNVGKSACFFCPSSRKTEVIELHNKHPDLLARALKIESQAELTTIKGLGRNYSWQSLIDLHLKNEPLPNVGFELPCGCVD